MGTGQIVTLGAIAGFTIFLGLPIARTRGLSIRARAFLNASAIGVLLFLLWDVLSHAVEPVEAALTAAVDHKADWVEFGGLAAVLVVGLIVGLVSLVYYDQWMSRRGRPQRPTGPGAMAVGEL